MTRKGLLEISDMLVEVHIHQLKHNGEVPSAFVTEESFIRENMRKILKNVNELGDVLVS